MNNTQSAEELIFAESTSGKVHVVQDNNERVIAPKMLCGVRTSLYSSTRARTLAEAPPKWREALCPRCERKLGFE